MLKKSIALLISLGFNAWAGAPQTETPQLTWEGNLAGGSVLSVQGKHVRVSPKDPPKSARPKIQITDPLPDIRQTVRVELRQGTGSVRILQQPRLENDYTLTVAVDTNAPGPIHCSLAFYWLGESHLFDSPSKVGH